MRACPLSNSRTRRATPSTRFGRPSMLVPRAYCTRPFDKARMQRPYAAASRLHTACADRGHTARSARGHRQPLFDTRPLTLSVQPPAPPTLTLPHPSRPSIFLILLNDRSARGGPLCVDKSNGDGKHPFTRGAGSGHRSGQARPARPPSRGIDQRTPTRRTTNRHAVSSYMPAQHCGK